MVPVSIHFPPKLVFGDGCLTDFVSFFATLNYRKTYVIADPKVKTGLEELIPGLRASNIRTSINTEIKAEPTVTDFRSIMEQATSQEIDSVIGIGGGSVLDVAKLIAALYKSDQAIEDTWGIGNLQKRTLYLACLPTTAGTGSEVSPNAILLNEDEKLKRGIVSPYLVPDAVFVDPHLTYTVPPSVTAATGVDALTHCIEAYANKFAHPMIDLYALQGIKLIYKNLKDAYRNPRDSRARANMALGSLYGGLCLGPVNTAAVHALAYPLGSRYKIAHGISNAILLPEVLKTNLPYAVDRYADIARAIGTDVTGTDEEVAQAGIEKVSKLCEDVDIPLKMTQFNIRPEDVPGLAHDAFKIQRLLKNNPKELTESDIREIYSRLF